MKPVNDNPLLTGLTQAEAGRRLRVEGFNELPSARPRPLYAIAWDVVTEPMFLLLMTCGIVYLLIGSLQDAIILLVSVCVIVAMSFFQERKSERTLEALRDLTSPRALVLRDGEPRRIAGRDVVRGDLIYLTEGDRVPADAVVVDAQNLSADESLLTGESVPVRKLPPQPEPKRVVRLSLAGMTIPGFFPARSSFRAKAGHAWPPLVNTRRWGISARRWQQKRMSPAGSRRKPGRPSGPLQSVVPCWFRFSSYGTG